MDRTPYQDHIIHQYYEKRDDIMLQRLGELVTDLYLAEGKKRQTLWKRVSGVLEKMNVPASRIAYIIEQDNPALLLKILERKI